MPEGPGRFSLLQIAICALVGAIASFAVLWWYRRSAKEAAYGLGEAIVIAVLVGLSILLWRLAGNTQPLNDDPIPLVSPNDVLCPVITYVMLGLYDGFHPAADRWSWGRLRALLTLVSLLVNIATI